MTALWPYSNGAVQIRAGLELADLNPGERHSRVTRDDGTVTLCALRATVLSHDCCADFGRPLAKQVMSHSRDGPGVTAPSRTNIVPLTAVWNPPPLPIPPFKTPRSARTHRGTPVPSNIGDVSAHTRTRMLHDNRLSWCTSPERKIIPSAMLCEIPKGFCNPRILGKEELFQGTAREGHHFCKMIIFRERKISPKFSCIKFFHVRDVPTQILGYPGHSLSKTTGKGHLHKVFVRDIPTSGSPDVPGTSCPKTLCWAAFPFLNFGVFVIKSCFVIGRYDRCFQCIVFKARAEKTARGGRDATLHLHPELWKRGKDPHPQEFSLTRRTARFTKGQFRPY